MNDLGRRKTLFLFWSGCFHYVTHCSVVPLVTLINTLHNGSLFLYRVTHKTTIQLSPCFSGAVLWLCFWCPPPVNVLVFAVTLYQCFCCPLVTMCFCCHPVSMQCFCCHLVTMFLLPPCHKYAGRNHSPALHIGCGLAIIRSVKLPHFINRTSLII